MSFTIDLSKNVQHTSLDIKVSDGCTFKTREYSDPRLAQLAKDFRKDFPPIGLMKLKNVFIFGNGFIMSGNRHRIQSPYLPYTYLTNEKGIKQSSGALRVLDSNLYRTRPLRFREIKGTAALLTQPGDGIFGHWLVDLVPMFSMIKSHFDDVTYIVKSSVLENQSIPDIQGVFDIINFDRSKAIGLTENLHAFHCEELIVPSAVRYGQQLHPYVNSLYKGYRKHIANPNLPEKIYFSRKKWKASGSHRHLMNAEEVENYFIKKGFTIIHPEEFSFAEKLSLIRNAKEIVGEKGTALHLCLFSSSISKMTVLLSPGEAMTGLPMLQDEICRMQNIECNYVVGKFSESGEGFVIDDLALEKTALSGILNKVLHKIGNVFR